MSRFVWGPAVVAQISMLAIAGVGTAQIAGDVSRIGAAVTKVEPVGKAPYGAIVTVKVTNRGTAFAEPLTFELSPKTGAPSVLRRVPGPYAGRAGRAAPPGGTQSYPLLFAGEHAALSGAGCRVLEVVFLDAAPAAEPPVVVGSPRADKRRHELGSTVDIALLPLENRTDVPVDAIVRVNFERPRPDTVLVHRRLEAREAAVLSFSDVVIEGPPDILPEGDSVAIDLVAPKGARIGSAKLVDWCAIASTGEAIASDAMKEAYSKWLRWEGPARAVGGSYVATIAAAAGPARGSQGAFGLSEQGAVSTAPDPALDPEDAARIKRAVTIAFSDLRRPPAAEAVALCKPRLDRSGPPMVIACDGDAWSPEFRRTRFAIDGGRIVGHDWRGGAPTDLHVEWRLEPFESGYVVAERRAFTIGGRGAPTEVHRWSYVRRGDLVVPARFSMQADLSPVGESWTLEVVFHYGGGDAPSGPVASPAAEAVRAAWNAGYRYPGTAVSFACRFVVKTGKDALWRGTKEVKGRMVFTGFAGEGRGRASIEVEGVADDSVRRTLAFTIDDRLGMWSGRDFAARGDFDRVFVGASFTERAGEPGTFDVVNGPYRAITVRDGRIHGLTLPDGMVRTFTWTKVHDQHVASKVVTGGEELVATFAPIGPLLAPRVMRFKGVFGDEREWGTEELTLTDFALR